jgi:hypothetical protein
VTRTIEPGGDGVGVGDGARVGLGLVALTALGRMGQTGCEGTEWESETSVRCLTWGKGIRGTRRVAMTAGERTGSGSAMYSVDVGSMSVTRGSNRAGTGSASVTVHGAGLGLVLFTAMGRMGQTGCEGTEWESETSVRCRVGHGATGHAAGGDDGGRAWGSLSQVMSFDAGSVSVSRRIEPGGDGVGVGDGARGRAGAGAFHGDGEVGADGMRGDGVGVGDVGAVPGGAWCSGHASGLTLTAGELSGSMSEGYSVDVTGMSVMGRGNHAGTGSASVTVHGSSLGLVALHGDGTDRADGMRGDGVGVGDVGAVPGGAWVLGAHGGW